MEIRPYKQEDLPELQRIHRAQGFAYPFPNLEDPLFHIKLVGEQDGRIVNAAVARLTAEVFFLMDPSEGTPRDRYHNFVKLHDEGCKAAFYQGGLSDIQCWMPPEIVKPFGRRLARLGWKRPPWTPFYRDLQG